MKIIIFYYIFNISTCTYCYSNLLKKVILNFENFDILPSCDGICATCYNAVFIHTSEVIKPCYLNLFDDNNDYDCWLYFILPRCVNEYGRKYCKSCDALYETEKYFYDMVEYYKIHDESCRDFEYKMCENRTFINKQEIISSNTKSRINDYFSKFKSSFFIEPNCTGECDKCKSKLDDHFHEINKACTIEHESNNLESSCWANYIKLRCLKLYARKYCNTCEELYGFEAYADEYIEYIQNTNCTAFDSNRCTSKSTEEPIIGASKNIVLISISVIASLALLILICVLINYIYVKYYFNKKMVRILNVINLLKERDKLSLEDIIGKGNYGCVYKGLYINENNIAMVVAVKSIKNGSKQTLIKSFFNEAMMLNALKHSRILTPIGVCIEPNGYPLIIFPLMAKGDLLSYLRNSQNSLTTKQTIRFALQIAEGMVFLSNKQFIHRDLAARNILLDNEMNIKISDFGLARDLNFKHCYKSKNKTALPLKWMAMESIEFGIYNTSTDVWSFGVLFWEILSRGSEPYHNIKTLNILDHIKEGNRLPKPDNCSDIINEFLRKCWSSVPSFRPDFNYTFEFLSIVETNEL